MSFVIIGTSDKLSDKLSLLLLVLAISWVLLLLALAIN